MPRQRLSIFVRAPQLGRFKTRLAATLGAEAALHIYQRLLKVLFSRLASLEPASIEIRHTPDNAKAILNPWIRPGWTLRPQGDGALGDRLARCMNDALNEGIERLVIIGSDCPDITASDIHSAWQSLEQADLVLGPAEDGGYWAIGLRKRLPEVFEGIEWSTASVLEQTLRQARIAGRQVAHLRPLSDVDTEKDWRAWLDRGGDRV